MRVGNSNSDQHDRPLAWLKSLKNSLSTLATNRTQLICLTSWIGCAPFVSSQWQPLPRKSIRQHIKMKSLLRENIGKTLTNNKTLVKKGRHTPLMMVFYPSILCHGTRILSFRIWALLSDDILRDGFLKRGRNVSNYKERKEQENTMRQKPIEDSET